MFAYLHATTVKCVRGFRNTPCKTSTRGEELARHIALLPVKWAVVCVTGELVYKLSTNVTNVGTRRSSDEVAKPSIACVCRNSLSRQGKAYRNESLRIETCARLIRNPIVMKSQ